ncbi:hypothetical protein BJ138DRAFT_1103658 [Hygrophoropsis aurantiaca]|uniref:Uncharacterized protein n=1 Tax=Hygrophoropsis aurantiaca TaxID=72124 RepID=A0ACB8A4U7_9AGAM|nr:hypothetical protein BJ138DRAFT_1103658 [Hygrophoropsis aurantiaca]
MADTDVFAAMGIAGFGKATKKRTLDPSRFDKAKREDNITPAKPALASAPTLPEAGPSNALKISADDESDDDESDDPGRPPHPTLSLNNGEDVDVDSDDEEPEFDPDAPDLYDVSDPQFPITHEATLKEHTKVISALALDPSGARVLSGSHDYDVKLWDFGGMTAQTRSFKTWEPAGSYYVNDLKYSNNGQQFLVISGTSQAKLFDREGEENGHVSDLSACAWHPKDAQYFITSSADSTIRIWDVEDKRKQKTVIVVKSKERGARTKVSTCAYSPDGKLISGACLDGALHMWQASSNFVRPNLTVENAHTKGTETGSVTFSVDGRSVLTRGGDDTVKLWDLRSFKKPLATRSGLTTLYPATNAVFSPDEKYILTGVGASSKGGHGKLLFLSRDGLEVTKELEMETTPVKVLWHSKINQIVTGLANGSVNVLYSPVTSLNGAKLLLAKGAPKKRTIEDLSDALAAPSILTPHALPMFRDGEGIVGGTKRKREKDRMDPRKSRRPELPVTGPGRGGRVGASATQHVVQNLVRDTTRDEDPREALLRYAKLAEDDPQWTGAWRQNQPKPVFADVPNDEDEENPPPTGNVPAVTDPEAPAAPPNGTPDNDVIPNIDEFTQHESDARHEPVVAKVEPAHLAARSDSTCVEIATPVDPDPASIPVSVPSGTPPPEISEDIKMDEEVSEKQTVVTNGVATNGVESEVVTNGVNGIHHSNGDVDMESAPTNGRAHSHDTPAADSVEGDSPMAAPDSAGPSTTYTTPNDLSSPRDHPNPEADEDDAKPPPAKRARKFSDADQASMANTASPPPITASSVQTNGDTPMASPAPIPPTPSAGGPSTISVAQHRFCLSTIRQLKKLKDAGPFLHPVDPIALNVPHYPTIIKNPMDLGTIERKLQSSNPAKPDPNLNNPRYLGADEFISDVRLVFSNSITFNGPEHPVSISGKHVESVFDKQIKQLPAPAEIKPPVVKKVATPPPPPPPPKKASSVRRASTSVPVIRRNEVEQATARPKREIHPPPPKDLPYADAPKKMRKVKTIKNDGTADQLKFCAKLLQDLHRKQHWAAASAFYEPVDPIKLDIPTYYKVIKKPMDMATMRKKLENHEYPTAIKFFDDFKLMIRNCFTFNPPGTPVNQAGIDLQRLFDEKWKSLPPLHEGSEEEEEEEEEEDSEEERARARRIANMEAQIESMRGNILALKSKPPVKEKKKKEKKEKAPAASTSKASTSRANKSASATNGTTKRKGKKQMQEDDVLSFDQKKDLSEAITKLDGQKLEKVIQIIHEGVPEIRDSTEEIELEIDLLPVHVLTKLYNFVLRPLRQPPAKRNRTGKGTGTGGLKRKSMDEDVEAEKIRQLEERMRLFDQTGSGGPLPPPPVATGRHGHDSEHSSDSSSGSDSSGSESE